MSDIDMADIANAAPVVLIGRGGGGTRLISQMVQSLGVFLGNDLNKSDDSVEWVKLIYAAVCGTYPVDGAAPASQEAAQFHAKARDILTLGGIAPTDPWGWKLPETTLIAGQVARAFPQARFIQLTRHPVTACCRRTHVTSRLGSKVGLGSLTAAYAHAGRDVGLMESDPEHIWNALTWAHQADVVSAATADMQQPQLIVRFEDICANPQAALAQIGGYLGLPYDHVTDLPDIDPTRLNAQAHEAAEAAEVWDICETQALALGYTRDAG